LGQPFIFDGQAWQLCFRVCYFSIPCLCFLLWSHHRESPQ
jgi:hypothetical protein